MAPRVLISDKLSPAAVDIFRARGIDVVMKTGLAPADIRALLPWITWAMAEFAAKEAA